MSEHPKREDYDSDGDFLDAMAKHYGIDPRMVRPLSEPDQLRADKGRLNFEIRILEEHIECLQSENASLKAEVERLTAFTTRTIIPNEELQAQVERLTKAGDEMDRALTTYAGNMKDNCFQCQLDWNAAKEGHNMWGVVAPYVVPPCIDRYAAKEGKQS